VQTGAAKAGKSCASAP